MADLLPFPRLVSVDDLPFRWPGEHPQDLFAMCDYGARAFNEGRCDCVAFECLAAEAPAIMAYMAKAHPNVSYAFGSGRKVLSRAIAAWNRRTPPAGDAPTTTTKE